MNGNNISKRDIRWLIYDIPCLILMLIIVVFAPHFLAHAAYSKKATHNANVRDVQFLLLIKGYHPGPTDGKCGVQTQSAIEEFKSTLANIPPGASCSIQFLDSIKASLITSLSGGPPAEHEIASQGIS